MKAPAIKACSRIVSLLVGLIVSWVTTTRGADGSADLFQARNGIPSAPTDPVEWVKGNAGQANSHYVEGYSIPYRVVISRASPGAHSLVLEWDTRQSGRHAIDYLTHYNRLNPHNQFGSHTQPEAILPLTGLAGSFAAPTTFAIPAPSSVGSSIAGQPSAYFNALPLAERSITIWNGSITSLVYVTEGSLSGDTAISQLRLDFTAHVSTVVIAFGGHIASRLDWGVGNSAADISGSPYHMRMVSFDGSGGNQDRSLQALAVIGPPACIVSGPDTVCAGTTNAHTATVDQDSGITYQWSILGNTSGASIVGPADGSSVQVRSGNGGTTYTIQTVVTSAGGSNACVREITVNAITTAAALSDKTACLGNSTTFSTTASGTGPFTYRWRKGAAVITGAVGSSLSIPSVTSSDAGAYCVEVTGACGTVIQCATLTVPPAPALTCPPALTVQCLGDVPPPAPDLVVTSGGSSAITVRHVGDAAVTNGCEIVITRRYLGTDDCGIGAVCEQLITVHDTIPPVIVCAPARMVECGMPWDFDAPTATDVCDANVAISVVNTVTNAQCGNTFTATRTWQATDACGNRSTCSQIVTVVDTTTPVITCVPGRAVECGVAWDFDAPSATDICGEVTIAIMSTVTNAQCGNTFTATRTWQATDACGNSSTCSQMVTVVDTTVPVITCVQGRTVECGVAWDFNAPSATDICGEVTIAIMSTVTNAQCGNTFTATRTWQATDACGNSSACSQMVTVVDTTAPVITCVPGRTVECGVAWEFDAPSATDVCGDSGIAIVVTGTVTNHLVANLFSATRTWQATDACDNTASCSQTITVVDTTQPVIVCPANITIACTDEAGAGVSFSASATDICDAHPQVTCQPPTGSIFAIGTTTVNCVAVDASGNRSECSFTVTVQDTEPPQIACPASFVVPETTDGAGSAVVSYPSATSTDNCDTMPMIVFNPPSGSTLVVGTHIVTCTATDDSGNQTSCTFTVQVVPHVIIANSTADSGPGTLRQAILDANAAAGTNMIQFAFPGNPPYTIRLLTPLPPLNDGVMIDGWSQLQFTGSPVIEVNGTNVVVPPPDPGTNSAGGRVGLVITAGGTVVRGLTLNGFDIGIRIDGLGGNVIQGNRIGTDVAGTTALPNTGDGIVITSPNNIVGGSAPSERNVVSGNRGSGIRITGASANANIIRGNYIGVASDGTSPLGNLLHGVRIGAAAGGNIIGGSQPGEGSVIAFNGGSGVLLDPDAGSGNSIVGNSIYANGGLGIDLGDDGSTGNDTGDVDEGPNGLQNAPVLSFASSLGGSTTIAGIVAGAPDTTMLLEFFLTAAPNGSGVAPALFSLGTTTVETDANGDQSFSATFPVAATALQFVTVTATDSANNTSEFAAAVPVGTPPVILEQPVGALVEVGASATFCVTAIGSQPLLYQWRLNGANVPNATNRCLTIPDVQLMNGGSYTVVIANDLGFALSEPALLSLVFGDGVVGDNFEDRVLLVNANGIKSGNNSAATVEPGEPLHRGLPGGKSVWYTWTPPGTGIATFNTAGSGFDTLLAVYSGSNLLSLVTEASDEDSGGFYTSERSFNVFEGLTYQIAIDGLGGVSGNFIINWTFEATRELLPVITNQPVSRTVASGSSVTFTVGAFGTCRGFDHDCRTVSEDGHPQHPDPQRVVSYQWFFNGVPIPGATRSTLTIDNVRESVLGLYYAELTDDKRTIRSEIISLQINETDQFVQNVQARDKFLNAVFSNPLQLGVPPTSNGSGGGGFQPASTVVRGYTGSQVFNTTGSSTEAGEEPICGVVGGASQWISFIAQESGTAFLNTDGSSYDTVFAVFTRATNSPALQLLGCDNNGGLDGRNSALVVPVVGGRTNFIVIDGVNGATGVLRLNYSLVTATLLSPIGTTPEGDSRVRVSGRPSLHFTIQRSSNLQNWSSLVTTNSASGVFDYVDPGSANLPGRFYRALVLP